MNKIRIHSKAYLYVVVAAFVIGAALKTTEGAGATFSPTLAQLVRIKDAIYPVAARPSGPSRLEQLAALKDDTVAASYGTVGASTSRLEALAAVKSGGALVPGGVDLGVSREGVAPFSEAKLIPGSVDLRRQAGAASSGSYGALIPGSVDLGPRDAVAPFSATQLIPGSVDLRRQAGASSAASYGALVPGSVDLGIYR